MPEQNSDSEMPPVTKGELIAFITITVIATLMIFGTLWLLQTYQNCWDKYPAENQAIQQCENH